MTTPFPFVAGQVLTAAQLNSISELPTRTLTATGNAVAADRYSRIILNGSSISYTVNSATFDVGEVVHLYNINSTTATIAAGTGGVTINAAAGLTLAQYQSAILYAVSSTSFVLWKSAVSVSTPGLVYLTGASFTTATSVSLPTNTFTSTYRNYRLLFTITAVTQDIDITCRLRASGSDDTNAIYSTMLRGINAVGTATDSTGNGQTSWNFGETDVLTGPQYAIDVMSPQRAERTTLVGNFVSLDKAVTGFFARSGGWTFNSTGVYDSLSVISSVASSMTGYYRVFGYADS